MKIKSIVLVSAMLVSVASYGQTVLFGGFDDGSGVSTQHVSVAGFVGSTMSGQAADTGNGATNGLWGTTNLLPAANTSTNISIRKTINPILQVTIQNNYFLALTNLDLSLGQIHVQNLRDNWKACRTGTVTYVSGNLDDTNGTVVGTFYIESASGVWEGDEVVLSSGLTDTLLAPGESATFELSYTGNTGAHFMYVDNLGISGTVVAGQPPTSILIGGFDHNEDPVIQDASVAGSVAVSMTGRNKNRDYTGDTSGLWGSLFVEPFSSTTNDALNQAFGDLGDFTLTIENNFAVTNLYLENLHWNSFRDHWKAEKDFILSASGDIASSGVVSNSLGADGSWNQFDIDLSSVLTTTKLAPGESVTFTVAWTNYEGNVAFLVDNFGVSGTIGVDGPAEPAVITSFVYNSDGTVTLVWDSQVGASYALRHNGDLESEVSFWAVETNGVPSGGVETMYQSSEIFSNPAEFFAIETE
ncbi:hypothetical protein [Pontiella sulfatireligans]|uniref:DUF11 domain-containing protein n=1 Tax=Pontiella sulfatireligans TaxID=2750658 RepID=A0A6C2UG39_9BACT|nr:hypothetical protein [Pontiella sulfatireligans]VGO18879.1 hypothetical protein SCARR_00932 [Pontiella sulfatireligans]